MENTITLIAKLSLLASILLRWTNADHGMCHTVRSVSDRALVGHVYKTLQEKQIATCVAACEMEKNCYSINFQLSTKTCELSRRNAKWYPGDVQLRADSVYLSMVLREYDPCVERTSPCAGTCISFPGSLATQCICNAGQNQSCQNNSCVPYALGMESGAIGNDQIKVSSNHGNCQPSCGRLKYALGSWAPLTDNMAQWFQVKFAPRAKFFTGIATQGNGKMFWYVTRYVIKYKLGDEPLHDYLEKHVTKIFNGNVNKDSIVTNSFAHPFKADTLRIWPKSYFGRIALRIELYGCDVV